MGEKVKIRLEITEEEYKLEHEAAMNSEDCELGAPETIKLAPGQDGGRAYFIEPISLVATATLAWICKRMIDHWLMERERGLQIDLRKDPVLFSRLAGVPNGFVVVIDQEGKKEVYQANYKSPEDLMPLVGKILAA